MARALIPARFVERPNRFIVVARLQRGGSRVRAHLADPGRLQELLLPGADLRLRPAATGGSRKTRYSVCLVRAPAPPYPWVCLETTRPNHLAAELLAAGRVRGVERAPLHLRREVRRGRSRFDFELADGDRPAMLVEVKSVTLVEDGVALFPDAPTARGVRHLRELTEYVRQDGRALVLFVVQRHDAREVRPHAETDPEFAAALREARAAGVLLRAARYRLDARGKARWQGPLPVRAGR